jgi:thioredoxin-related protein
VFIAIWIVIFGFLTMYLLGKLKLPHDSELKHISVPRLLLGVLTGFFTIYMIPGLWGAPLKLIAAFPPPISYSESPLGVGYYGGGSAGDHEEGKHLVIPGVYSYHDYDEGLAKAKELGKPLMLDFTGHACVNCRKMEQQVWSDSDIKSMLANDVVLVSLYVDQKTPLPVEEQVTVELTGGREKKLRTVGNKWAAFQEIEYGVNAQPYYVLLDHDEKKLIEPSNYQDYGTVDEFKDWLRRGVDEYKKK